MFGIGDMYQQSPTPQEGHLQSEQSVPEFRRQVQSPKLDFDQTPVSGPQNGPSVTPNPNSVRSTRLEMVREEVKNLDKPQRRVMEIRVFYDDQTWETFIPSRK